MAFLVSTPESGVDSILLTYALTDPILTVARPVSAYLTALTAGLVETIGFESKPHGEPSPAAACADDCDCAATTHLPPETSLPNRLMAGITYAYTDIMADLAPYMLVGFLLAGLVGALIGQSGLQIPESVSGWVGYAWAVGAGVPLYVCATSSTPLAAVLLGAGLSPGAILVFLLVGPATNVAGIVVMRRIIGGWSTVRYLISIVVVAILCGLALDSIYRVLAITPVYRGGHEHEHGQTILALVSAFALSGLILYYSGKKLARRLA